MSSQGSTGPTFLYLPAGGNPCWHRCGIVVTPRCASSRFLLSSTEGGNWGTLIQICWTNIQDFGYHLYITVLWYYGLYILIYIYNGLLPSNVINHDISIMIPSLVGGWPTPLKNDGLRQLGKISSQYYGKVIIHSCSKPPTSRPNKFVSGDFSGVPSCKSSFWLISLAAEYHGHFMSKNHSGWGCFEVATNVNPGLINPKRLFNWGDTI